MRKKSGREFQNFLDYVPAGNSDFAWEQQEDGTVVVTMPHKGFFDRLAQCPFRRPRCSRICLDELGSFIWTQIDGSRSIFEISALVQQQFGERAEPIVNRLVAFFRVLETHHFVHFRINSASVSAQSHPFHKLQKG